MLPPDLVVLLTLTSLYSPLKVENVKHAKLYLKYFLAMLAGISIGS